MYIKNRQNILINLSYIKNDKINIWWTFLGIQDYSFLSSIKKKNDFVKNYKTSLFSLLFCLFY